MHKNTLPLLLLASLLCVIMAGCQKTTIEEKSTQEPLPTLTVGMMSAVDAAPFYLALERGYFTKEGVDVELILFTNGQHRQTALQTAQVDGAMTDLVALITQSASDFKLTGTLSTDGDFPLLANSRLEEKDSISVGTMEISVTNYLVDRYLEGSRKIEKVYINEIPARLEAVSSGQIDAGIFPEPFASIGELRGLSKLFFEGLPAESLNIIAFTDKAIEEKEEALYAFHAAYARAVKDIQEHEDLAREVLMQTIANLPPDIRNTMHLPRYQNPSVPGDEFVREVMQWTASITNNTYGLTPSEIIDGRFVKGL